MNARGFRSMSVTLLLLGASVAIMAASANRFTIYASRELKIAIVDVCRTTPERNQFRAQVAATLKTVVADSGADVLVRPIYVGARDAKLKLTHGAYDAALVIGEDRPAPLQRMDLVTLAGVMQSRYGALPVSLILTGRDPEVAQCLRSAFGRLVTDRSMPVAAATSADAMLDAFGG